MDVGYIVGNKITRRHNDPNKSKDWGSSLVYNEFMHAWVTYELVQVLHIYGLTPAVRSNLNDVSSDLFKIETFMRDRTSQDSKDSEDAEKLIQQLFAGTEHIAIFKQMGFRSMTHFKQLTSYAMPFLLITWLHQLQEHFFLNEDKDFFKEGMYAAIASRKRGTTTTNNIWMSKIKDTTNHARVISLAFFQPRQTKNACVTLRGWAEYIFKCEFEPKSLDASSKEILACQDLTTKKYNMLRDDLTWGKLHTEEKSNSKAKTPMVVSTMDDKKLYLNVCQAMKANASNTKKKHDNLVNTEAIMALVEIMNRKFKRECINLKEAIKYLTQAQTAKLFECEEQGRR